MEKNIDEQLNKNVLFKPKTLPVEEEIKTNSMLNNTQSFLNRSSMMTYSKM